jgi:hypothetical protein
MKILFNCQVKNYLIGNRSVMGGQSLLTDRLTY